MCKEDDLKEGEKYKNRKEDDGKDYKGKKSCYIADGQDSNENDDEVVYVAMKDESDEDEATTLMTCVNKNDRYIIDSGCSHYMIGDKSKFITLTSYNGNSVRFGNNVPYLIKGKGSIKLIDKISCDNAYYVDGLKYNLLSVSQLNKLGCKVELENKITKIYDTNGKLIGKGDQTRSNLLYLDIDDATCLVAKLDET